MIDGPYTMLGFMVYETPNLDFISFGPKVEGATGYRRTRNKRAVVEARHGRFQKWGPQNRPQYTMIVVIGTLKRAP